MTKFKIGEELRITGTTGNTALYAKVGGKAIITGKFDGVHYPCKYETTHKCGMPDGYISPKNLERIVSNATDRRLTEAEAEIATLKAKVAALETVLADKSTLFPRGHSKSRFMWEVAKASITPNQRRADVIKRAQAFVAEWESKCGRKILYVVNAEKRTVVALKHRRLFGGVGEIIGKGIAKCAPDDVFNADIGKAIALGRALGVKVPKEFTDAPKPAEVVVGMKVAHNSRYGMEEFVVTALGADRFTVGDEGFFWNYRLTDGTCEIINDTDAVYS